MVLEPRRLATRMAARRVADELGDPLGETVGYTVRFEDVSSSRTRIRFVTEGVLGRRLITAPTIDDVAVVVIDEFHERHLQGDLALALVESLRRSTRPDLRLVVMSATLATEPLAAYLNAPVLRAEGRRFDVALEYLPSPDDRPLGSQVASAVRRCVAEGLEGDILVFLPGAAEIRRAQEACEKIAAEADLILSPLHGDLSPKDQDAVVRPAARRKVILSTNVAESSVTIEGVVAVIDSGLVRVASHSPWSGLPRLRVEKISRASATQRAGRAGRMVLWIVARWLADDQGAGQWRSVCDRIGPEPPSRRVARVYRYVRELGWPWKLALFVTATSSDDIVRSGAGLALAVAGIVRRRARVWRSRT